MKKVFITGFLTGICIGVLSILGIQYFYKHPNKKKADLSPKEDITPLSTKEQQNIVSDSTSTKEKPVTKKIKETEVYSYTTDGTDSEEVSSLNFDTPSSINDEKIAQDELLFLKTIPIPYTSNKERLQELDSLLIDDNTPQKKDALRVEFWRSPINYTGYRMNSDKLILFGFYQPEEVSFEFKDQKIQIKYKDSIFLLEKTDNFKSLYIKHNQRNKK